jgi:hypothetical protein
LCDGGGGFEFVIGLLTRRWTFSDACCSNWC